MLIQTIAELRKRKGQQPAMPAKLSDSTDRDGSVVSARPNNSHSHQNPYTLPVKLPPTNAPHYKLLALVMTGRANLVKRNSLRDSWFKDLDGKEASARFVIGTSPNNKDGLDDALKKEMAEFGDLIQIPSEDIYINLPLKLRDMYVWAAENVLFDYVLKTDDDSFVVVQNILKSLPSVPKKSTWWSHFRCNWDRHTGGKWKEVGYTADKYPCFGCGGGNVFSQDIIYWIAENSQFLLPYANEDVTMGIWMAATKVQRKEEPRFHVDRCQNDMFTMPELKHTTVVQFHQNLVKCGKPCAC